jgi:hypothetical protein
MQRSSTLTSPISASIDSHCIFGASEQKQSNYLGYGNFQAVVHKIVSLDIRENSIQSNSNLGIDLEINGLEIISFILKYMFALND